MPNFSASLIDGVFSGLICAVISFKFKTLKPYSIHAEALSKAYPLPQYSLLNMYPMPVYFLLSAVSEISPHSPIKLFDFFSITAQ